MLYNVYSPFKEGLRPNVQKTNKMDGLFVILFGPLILKIVSPLDPHSIIARRNPGNEKARCTLSNPLRAKFFRGNTNIYLHFVSFLHIDATQVVEILPQVRQEPTYST